MTLREYRPGDEAAMLRLMHATIHSVNAAEYSPVELAAWCPTPTPPPEELAARRASFAQNHTLLAVGADRDNRETLLGWADMDATGYLDHLFVASQAQRQDVATALLAAMEAYAIGQGIQKLTTYSSITARPFFTAMGFRVLRPNSAKVRGQCLANFLMEKAL